MAILTKPAVIKNTAHDFTLNKTELLAHYLVVADPFFSNSDNWSKVVIVYKSQHGNQSKTLVFDASGATNSPLATFFASEKSRDVYLIDRISIYDFDGDSITLKDTNLDVQEFNIDMTPVILENFLLTESGEQLLTESGEAIILE